MNAEYTYPAKNRACNLPREGERMEIAEIAKRTGMSEVAVYHHISRGLRRIARAGEAERFATVVRLTHLKNAGQVNIRCGSIECRPEKWVFF